MAGAGIRRQGGYRRKGFGKHRRFRRTGYLRRYYRGRYRSRAVLRPGKSARPAEVDCPEKGGSVCFSACAGCEKFRVWHEQDEGLRRCYHEYKDLESRGYYDGTWDDHPENFDEETFERIQERKRLNEEVNRELEQERADLGMNAEELEENTKHEEDYGRKNPEDWREEGEEGDEEEGGDDFYEDEEKDYF